MSVIDGNVAFKCTFNDGGAERGFVGFDGACSSENIIRNVRGGKTWCSSDECKCKAFFDNDLRGPRPKDPCYESTLFKTLTFGPGFYQQGPRMGEFIPMRGAREGKVALLTTRLPTADREDQRVVFGLYKIAEIREDEQQGIAVVGDPEWAVRLPREAAPRYWRFKAGSPDWRTGLFRFVSDQEVCDLLHATKPLLRSPRDRLVVEHLLNVCGSLPSTSRLNVFQPEIQEVELRLKYGPGGEGDRHRRLKEYLHKHPEVLGHGPARRTEMEFRFRTGDRVDLAVRYPDDSWSVVEVEVEGDDGTLTGAHQVLKYRALLSGHLDGRATIRGVLAAYSVPKSVRAFCRRHDVQVVEIDEAKVKLGKDVVLPCESMQR